MGCGGYPLGVGTMDKIECYRATNGKHFDAPEEAEREDLYEEYKELFKDILNPIAGEGMLLLVYQATAHELLRYIVKNNYKIIKNRG